MLAKLSNAKDLNEKINFDFSQSKSREEELSKGLALSNLNVE